MSKILAVIKILKSIKTLMFGDDIDKTLKNIEDNLRYSNSYINMPDYKLNLITYDDVKDEFNDNDVFNFEFPENYDPKKKTILTIDDSEGITKTPFYIIENIDEFNTNDWNFIRFYNNEGGKLLIKWLKENSSIKIDVALIDLLINGVDGIDVLNAIKEVNPNVKYAFYTGVNLSGNEYRYNKARAKYNKYFEDDGYFEDKCILKADNFQKVILKQIINLLREV